MLTHACMHADGIPIGMRIMAGSRFEPGPFSLGRWSPYFGWVAISWVVVITVRRPTCVLTSPSRHTAQPLGLLRIDRMHAPVPLLGFPCSVALQYQQPPCRACPAPGIERQECPVSMCEAAATQEGRQS